MFKWIKNLLKLNSLVKRVEKLEAVRALDLTGLEELNKTEKD